MIKKAQIIAQNLEKFFQKAGFQKAVVGLSGGVDSALTAKLAVIALGKENVTGILMPNVGVNSDHSVSDANAWAKELGIERHTVPIQSFLENYKALPWNESEVAQMNLQARVRMTILYHYANSHGALVLGTGNRTEEVLGYFTKYGDGGADVLPIGNLYKMEVWEMSKALNLPESIIQKPPSAELREGHTDEEEIGMSYGKVDEILRKFEAGGVAETEQEKVLWDRIEANRHKHVMPPVIKILDENQDQHPLIK